MHSLPRPLRIPLPGRHLRCLRVTVRTISLGYQLHRSAGTVCLPCSQDLDTRLRDKKSVLKLRRPLAVHRDARPVVGPRLVAVAAKRDHGLDCEAHAGLRFADGFVLGVVRYVGYLQAVS